MWRGGCRRLLRPVLRPALLSRLDTVFPPRRADRALREDGESMPAPCDHDEEDVESPSDTRADRARRWRRTALAMAILFASLPVAGKVLLGSWGFDSAPAVAALCLIAAAYLYWAGRERRHPIPDSATILDEAIQRAAAGETDRALALLDEALRLDRRLWQARQYSGQVRLSKPGAAEAALQDFTAAIDLAPGEPHLYILRSHVFALLGCNSAARADLDTAARLGRNGGAAAPTEEPPPG
jgi:tetratricopeptide (TPR) repeat protein